MKKALLMILFCLMASIPVLAQDDFPPITIDSTEQAAAGDLYFIAAAEEGVVSEFGNYLVIMSNEGEIIFQQATLPQMRAYDFRPYPNGYTSFWQQTELGIGGRGGFGMDGYFEIMDIRGVPFQQYHGVDAFTTGHEHQLLENENLLLIVNEVQEMDLREFGGVENATVVTSSLQEITPEGEVVWYWSGWDHLLLEDCIFPDMLIKEAPQPVAYAHINGFTLTPEGDIIASVRHFDQLIKIDRETGEIVWHMGGPKAIQNDFTFVDDPYNGTSHQHNPTLLPNGHLMMFDNGNLRDTPFSRVVEYELDEDAMTATLVWSYDADESRFSDRQGSAQRLPNGNTLIGWGNVVNGEDYDISEVTPDGEIVLSVTLPPDFSTYRAYKLELMEGY